MNEHYPKFLAEDQAESLQDLGVTDAQLNQYLRQSSGLRYAIEDYLEKLAAGFTPEDILLCQELGFWYERHTGSSSQSGHERLWTWVERKLRLANRYGATVTPDEFADALRRLVGNVPYSSRKQLLKEYCYARRYTDLSHGDICRLQSELLAIKPPMSWERHTLRTSYLRLTRLGWSHKQILELLPRLSPGNVMYVVQGTHKGMSQEDVMQIVGLRTERQLVRVVCLMRTTGVTSSDASDILALTDELDATQNRSPKLGSSPRPARGYPRLATEATYVYKAYRRSGELHDEAMSAARQAAADCQIDQAH